MRARFLSPLLFLALVPFASATDPPAPKPAPVPKIVVADGGKQPAPTPTPTPTPSPIPTSIKLSGMECEFLTLTGYTGVVSWDVSTPDSFSIPVKLFECKPKTSIPAWRVGATEPQAYDVGDLPTVQVFAVGSGRATLAAWGVADGKPVKLATFAIEANTGPRPPPDPGPGPGPDPKPPEPAKTFRVIFVVESGKGLTTAQDGVINGTMVESYLTKTCTGGKDGWRRRDPDSPAGTGVLGELWTAAKQAMKPGDVPCVIVEKNGKAEIIPVEPTPEAMIAKFNEYVKGAR